MDAMEMEVAEEQKVQVEPRIEVVKAEGLSEEAIAALTQYIQSISLPDEVSGDLTLEIWTNNGRVRRVILDEENSTITDENVVQAVRSVLLGWPVPSSVQGTVSLTLRVNGN
jgi:Ca-activated chloride channel family protein